MNRDEARRYIIEHAAEHLTPDKTNTGYICPICGSGSGANGTGITSKDKIHFTCWRKGCFTNADIIDIIGLENGLTDYNNKLNAAAKIYGITINNDYVELPKEQIQPSKEEDKTDYTSFFLQANRDIDKTNYHRGISLETLNKFKVGYVANWVHPKAPKMTPNPRLIIPTSKYSYLARYAGDGNFIDYRGKENNKSKVGKVSLFNSKALYTASKPIFVVEGEIDALSIIDVGGSAVALGSISNAKKFIDLVSKQKPCKPLILALDNDKKGQEANEELAQELAALNIPFYRLNPCGAYKDANEALQKDRSSLEKAVSEAEQIQDIQPEENTIDIDKYKLKNLMQGFCEYVAAPDKHKALPTEFTHLNEFIGGGIFPKMYIINAMPSIGKTTFALQIADGIAKAGNDVIIFSLEMLKEELIARSISRNTFKLSSETAKTENEILNGGKYSQYSTKEIDIITKAQTQYFNDCAEHISIIEGRQTAQGIKDIVKEYINQTGNIPLVVVDYLQIITPSENLIRSDRRTQVINDIDILNSIKRELQAPLIIIGSVSRSNYDDEMGMDAGKESGEIEYTADCVMNLSYEVDMWYTDKNGNQKKLDKDYRELKIMKAKKQNPRYIKLKLEKNRGNAIGKTVCFRYYPAYNIFYEDETKTNEYNK